MAFHFQECFLCDDELQASTRPEETINYGVLYCLKVMECLKGFGEFISFLISYWHIIFLQRTLVVTIYCASTDENSTNGELFNSLEGRSPKNHLLTFMLFQTYLEHLFFFHATKEEDATILKNCAGRPFV